MSTAPDPRLQELAVHIAARLEGGSGPRAITAELMEQGWTREQAEGFILQVEQARTAHRSEQKRSGGKAQGRMHMVIGASVFGAGVVFTTMSYSSPSADGRFMLFYGAILIGAIQFLYGLFGYLNQTWK